MKESSGYFKSDNYITVCLQNGMMDRSSKRNWNPRHNSERSVDDEPEWFTSGPTSRLDTIELKGFEGMLPHFLHFVMYDVIFTKINSTQKEN